MTLSPSDAEKLVERLHKSVDPEAQRAADVLEAALSSLAEARETIARFPIMALACDLKCDLCTCGYKDWSESLASPPLSPAPTGRAT